MKRRDFLCAVPALINSSLVLASETQNHKLNSETLDDKLQLAFKEISLYHSLSLDEYAIVVLGEYQKAYLLTGSGKVHRQYPVSTSPLGYGFVPKSGKTPVGVHKIREKIGDNVPIGGIFIHWKYTGEIATICLEPKRTWNFYILTRIMTLESVEERNRTTNIRPILFHGTGEEGLIGKPASRGCIRMKNLDIVDLFNLVKKGTYVNIVGK